MMVGGGARMVWHSFPARTKRRFVAMPDCCSKGALGQATLGQEELASGMSR
jgi:hypothetical protein